MSNSKKKPTPDPGFQTKRQHLRFTPKGGKVAFIDTDLDDSFEAKVTGLVVNQSYSGVALVVLNASKIEVDTICRVKVGALSPLKAKVLWKTSLDEEVVKVGVIFLE